MSEMVGRYVYLSQLSAYADWPDQPVTEDSPLREATTKAEGDVRAVARGRWAILRLGQVLDPFDVDGDLGWWLVRIAGGGQVLAPGAPDRPLCPVDVRDVAAFVCDQALVGHRRSVFNVVAPARHTTTGALLDACRTVTGSDATWRWVPDEALREAGVVPSSGLPLWHPSAAAWQVDSHRAEQAGLTCRPTVHSVTDAWRQLTDGRAAVPAHFREAMARSRISTGRAAELIQAHAAGGPVLRP
ncbi:NAD-dependent epimerase [Streptomyces sp. NPDC059373]